MGIDPAPFWANLFLYTYENEYTSELISNDQVKARHFHATKRFIDDIRTLNDGGVFNVYKDIYPPELQLKVDTLVHMQLSLTWISQLKMECSFTNVSISVMLFPFLLLACSTLIVKSQINILFCSCW